MKRLIAFLNQPLPKGACWAFGKVPPCKVDWEVVILLVAIIIILGMFV